MSIRARVKIANLSNPYTTTTTLIGRRSFFTSTLQSTASTTKDERIAKSEVDFKAKLEEANVALEQQGFDRESFWVQPVCWGDHDQFQHVNNCNYVRWFESGRMRFVEAIAQDLSPEEQANIIRGTGISFILASITVKYRRPLLYPDTVVVGSSPILPLASDRFTLRASMYSLAQKQVVSTSEQVNVCYDYNKLSKTPWPDTLRSALEARGISR